MKENPRVLKMHVDVKPRAFPPDTVYVGRPSKFGNLFPVTRQRTRDEACDLDEKHKRSSLKFLSEIREELKGQDLVCFCAPLRCHADFLLLVANSNKPIESFYQPLEKN